MTIHEFGHQYFYGMLASNEFEEPWLDEGFTSWFTHKAIERSYLPSWGRRFQVGTDFGEWAGYWLPPSTDPLTRFGFKTRNMQSYFVTAYAKPTLVLNQLEAMLGRPVMEQVVRTYAQEMAFRHPTRNDFRRIAERVSGRDLSSFWRDFVEGTDVLDYAIRGVKSQEVTQGGGCSQTRRRSSRRRNPPRPARWAPSPSSAKVASRCPSLSGCGSKTRKNNGSSGMARTAGPPLSSTPPWLPRCWIPMATIPC
ncbi:MAG: hypothetical protein IPI84_01480 [Holophagaceae bacterium]|nr:hypothetical protein [Holophagaceae bacterium]